MIGYTVIHIIVIYIIYIYICNIDITIYVRHRLISVSVFNLTVRLEAFWPPVQSMKFKSSAKKLYGDFTGMNWYNFYESGSTNKPLVKLTGFWNGLLIRIHQKSQNISDISWVILHYLMYTSGWINIIYCTHQDPALVLLLEVCLAATPLRLAMVNVRGIPEMTQSITKFEVGTCWKHHNSPRWQVDNIPTHFAFFYLGRSRNLETISYFCCWDCWVVP